MATYGDLKTRIIAEMVRDDLADGEDNAAQLANAVKTAIRFYKVRDWWFLTFITNASTVVGQNYITRPTTIERIQRVSVPALGYDLCREDITALEAYDEPTVQSGQPQSYAEYGTKLRIWPLPATAYSIKIIGTQLLNELSQDTDTNAWTNYAQDLIVARAKGNLYRFFRDDDGVARAAAEEVLALQAMEQTHIDRLDAPMQAGW